MDEEKKPLMAAAIITLIAIGGLFVLFDNSTNGVTGALTGQQTAYSKIYGLKYHYNPCSILSCTWGKAGIPTGVDEATGDVFCRCPNQKVAYFRINPWTKR